MVLVLERTTTKRRASALGQAYWWVWTATTISAFGDGLALVAFPLLAMQHTSDARLIAGVAVAQRLPWLLCSLLTGALADRVQPRRFLAAVEWGRTAILVVLATCIVLGAGGLALLYLAAFGLGSLETGYSAAALGVTPSLVADRDLGRANGYLYAGQTAGEQFIGPAIGGVVFAAGAAAPFIADGFTFLVSAVLLTAALRGTLLTRTASGGSLVADTREGLQWFRAHAGVRNLAAAVASLAFCQAMVLSILVLLCVDTLGLSPAGYGIFLAVGAVGNLLGGAAAGRVTTIGTRDLLRIGGLVAALAYATVALAPNAAIAAAAFVVEAVAVALGNVATVSLRQRLIPPDLLGRVGNIFRTCVFGAMPLGALAAGFLAEMTSPRVAIFAAAALQWALVSVFARRVPADTTA